MRILFLTHPYPNYVPDLLLHGLRHLLGGDVVDWPRKDCVYQGVLGLGVCPPDQLAPGWFPADDGIDRTDIDGKLAAGYFDYLVTDVRAHADFNRLFPRARLRGAAVIDGEDSPLAIAPGPYLRCRREHTGEADFIPLPMAMPAEILARIAAHDRQPKRHPVGFVGSAGGASSARRAIVRELMEKLPEGLWLVSDIASPDNPAPAKRLGREDYYRAMQSCRMVLTLRGAGWDTFRFWEHAACRGAHAVEAMPLVIPDPFVDGRDRLTFRTPAELLNHVDALMAGRIDADALAQAGREHLHRFHLTTHRASAFIDGLRRAFHPEDPVMTQTDTTPASAVIDELKRGMNCHLSDDLLGAEASYRRVLELQPGHPDALHMLGVIGYQIGDFDVAIDLIGHAIAGNGRIADYHNNLGEAYRAKGESAEARRCYLQALQIDPAHAKASNNLSRLEAATGTAG
jgi:tetratricopeptide (TPR) repeat protein